MRRRQLLWKMYECSLDAIEPELVEKVLASNPFADPVFDVVAENEEQDQLGYFSRLTEEERYDSTVTNHFWELADFYSSQWIILKRTNDKEDAALNGVAREIKKLGRVRTKRIGKAQCTALSTGRENRTRCPKEARYIYESKTKSGNYSYQRRCEECFYKVKDKSKYRPIRNGRYFRVTPGE